MKTFNTQEARKWMVAHPMEELIAPSGSKRRWNPEKAYFEGSSPNQDNYFLTACVMEQTYTLPEPQPKEITDIEEALKCEKLVVSNRFNDSTNTYYAEECGWVNYEIKDIKLYCTDPDFTVKDGE